MAQHRTLAIPLLAYGAASLVHFVHNAEFLVDYPGLPSTWTRGGVYAAWLAMTAVGVCGWWLINRGREVAGLIVLACYAVLGIDSLGHYLAAPFASHTPAMNATILLEVTAGALVLGQAGVLVARLRRASVLDPGV